MWGLAMSISPPRANPNIFASLELGENKAILQLLQLNEESVLHSYM